TLYTGNTTLDLLVGGVSTASAKFAIINVNNGTPIASLSAGTAGGAFLTANGTLATTAKQSLSIGDANTGNILVGSGATDRAGAGISVRGSTTDQYVAEFYGRDATYAGFGIFAEANNATPFLQFGDNSGTSGTPLVDWSLTSTTGTNTFDFRAGIANASSVMSLGTTGNLAIEGALSDISDQTLVVTDNLDVRGNLGTTASASVSGKTSFAGLLIDNTGSGDISTASTGGVSKFPIQNNGTIVDSAYTTAGGIFYGNANGSFGLSAAGAAGQLLQSNGAGAPVWVPSSSINYWDLVGNALSSKFASVQDLLLGSNATSSAKFAFINVNAGTPTASIAANTANNALTLDGLGNIGTTNRETLSLGTASTGDINFVVGGSNNLRINGVAGANVSANCVNTTNGIVTSSATCPAAAATFIWNTGNGSIFEGNTTQDLLIGGQGTSSAKFAVINVNNGTPVASLSAGTAGGSYLTAAGLLQTTANQTLTLGGDTTGNIVVAPKNGSGTLGLSVGGLTINNLPGASSASLTCVSVSNGIVTSAGACGAGSGGSVWT